MNLTEFLAELRKTRNGWTANGVIRKADQDERLCPITAVCESVTKTRFSMRDYLLAGGRLGLDPKLAKRIVTAADFNRPEQRWLRSRLLKAVGK